MKTKNFIYLTSLVIINSKQKRLSWNLVNKKFELNRSFKKYFSYIGRDFKDILKKLKIKNKNFKDNKKNFKNELIRKFNKYKLYPGVKGVLNKLKKKKIKIGIVTSKDCLRTNKILKKFSLKFNEVRCSDNKNHTKTYIKY